MPNIIRPLICFTLCTFLPAALHAEIEIEASIKFLNFDYEEFDLSGRPLNKETGVIPGLSLSASKMLYNITNRFGFELYDGQVDYDGQTQAGAPHQTNTDETLYRLSYRLDWSPQQDDNAIYGKIAWQQWDRNILPANNISGLFEQYQWWTLELGFMATLYENRSNLLLLELGVSRISNGTILIDLSRQGFGEPELKLGDSSGFSTALVYQHELTTSSSIGITMRYHRWKFGRSNTETISNGVSTFNITEPRSVSQHSTISFDYRYRF